MAVGAPRLWIALRSACALLAIAPGAGADVELTARLACEPLPAPGRVLCEVELTADRGSLVWGDALVVESPEFARPLRARVGATRNAATSASRKISLAFVATRTGRAPVEVLARAVLCAGQAEAGAGECRPEQRRLRAELSVGAGL